MAQVKISDLGAGAAISGAHLFECVQGGTNVKVTGTQLQTWAVSGLGTMSAQAASAVAITGGTAVLSKLNIPSSGALTIASDAITVTGSRHTVDTEAAAASDNLSTINGLANGDILVLSTVSSGRAVVIKNATGNILCGADFTLSNANDVIFLYRHAGTWIKLAAADNA